MGPAIDPSCCVAEVMGTELFTLTPDTVVASALRLASARRIRHFLVIEDGSLTGIVCQSDLRQARESSLISGCMKSPVLCIGPDTTVKDAVDIMDQNEVGCLPVVTGTFLVGMITRDRLSKLTGRPAARSLIASVEVEDPVEEEAEVEPSTCTACGKADAVRLYYRAGNLPLCGDCAEVLPVARAPRGN
jgi:CBS domain-containing protein